MADRKPKKPDERINTVPVIDELVEEYREQLERWCYWGFDAVIEASSETQTTGVFRGKHRLDFDEPPYNFVSEGDTDPCPHDYLIAGVVGCQVETLQQALEKARVADYEIRIECESKKGKVPIVGDMPDFKDTFITDIYSDVTVRVPEEDVPKAERCLDIYMDNCTVSQSVEAGIECHTNDVLETY